MKKIQRSLSLLLALMMLLSSGALAFGEADGPPAYLSSQEIIALMGSEEPFDASLYTPIMQTSPDNDFRTDLQYSYLMDPDVTNIYAYSHGVEELSQPKGIVCDFSGDGVGTASSYIIQRASSEDFSDAVTVEGLAEPSYAFQNLLLGEHFYWRGGTSPETIGISPVHETTVTDVPPRVCYVEGCKNIRDIGGYESSLVPGGRIRQGVYYRGANINGITAEGQRQLRDELGVRVEIDMRDEDLCLGPYVDGVEYYTATIPSTTEAIRFEEFSSVYKDVFSIIANADKKPVFLHCSSGADRTGIVTFMLLTVCGVSYEDIARDYLFTNFTDERIRYIYSEFDNWYAKLDMFEGDSKADEAKQWLKLKGVPETQIERIREILVEGYESPEPVYEYTYTVSPADGEAVDFHTELQQAFLSDPYNDEGVIEMPAEIEIDGVTYPIDGNPFDSADLATRVRTHDDWSIPDPVTLSWEGGDSDSYYVEISPNEYFLENVRTFTTSDTSVDIYNLFIGTTYYWRIAPIPALIDKGAVYTFTTSSQGPRNLYIDGVTNVRDLGGYELEDGSGVIRQGLLIRGGRLNLSNANDDKVTFSEEPDYYERLITSRGLITMIDGLGVKTELDVRTNADIDESEMGYNEIGNMNNDRITGLEYVNIPLWYYGGDMAADNNITRLDNPERLKEIFELLADESNYPIFFHCNIGTDRTGTLAFLVGALCGLSVDDMLVDNAFSNFGNISAGVGPTTRSNSVITGETGCLATVNAYPGDTLSERTENALIDICGLSKETLDRVREILVEYY